jgi:ABC-2 type transport system permease protein
MSVWKAMLRIFIQKQVVHREFWLVLVLNGVLPLLVPLLAWSALADAADGFSIQGWTVDTFMQYYVLNFLIYSLSYTSIHHEMGALIRTGQMNYWLLRPLSFAEFALSFSAARVLVMSVFSLGVLVLLVTTGFVTFQWAQLFLALQVVPLSVVLLILMTISIGMLAFWLIECDGAFAAILLFLQFFGGLILPLDLFPPWIRPVSAILPLQYVFGLPAEAIVRMEYGLVPVILFGQSLWILALCIISAVLWRRGIHYYDAVGA